MKELKNYKSSNNNNLLLVLPLNKVDELILNETFYSISEQEKVIDLLILAHELNKDDLDILKTILASPTVEREKLVEGSKTEKEKVQLKGKNSINYIIEETTSDAFAKVYNEAYNYALKNNYTWFSVFEYDDLFSKNWLSYFNAYSTRKTEFDGFFPLTKETSNLGFTGFMNEACWADGFAEVAGTFDHNLILKYNCMNITGAVIKTESLKAYSEEVDGYYKPMKESMKLNATYEFLIRMIYNDLKFYTIPRIGYDHRVNKPADKVDYFISKLPAEFGKKTIEEGGMTEQEYKFWLGLPIKEYFFETDRNKTFQPA